MISSTTRSGLASAAAASVLAAALGACAAPVDTAADAAAGAVRVSVKLSHGSEDGRAIAAEAARIAGVPVDYAAATSRQWHALVLRCGAVDRCEAAIGRLRAATTIYEAVELDGRKTRAAS